MLKILQVFFGIGISYPLLKLCIQDFGIYFSGVMMFCYAIVALGIENLKMPNKEEAPIVIISATSFSLLIINAAYLPAPLVAAIVGMKPCIDLILDHYYLKQIKITQRQIVGITTIVLSSLLVCFATLTKDVINFIELIPATLYILSSSIGQLLRTQHQLKNSADKAQHILPTSLLFATFSIIIFLLLQGDIDLLTTQTINIFESLVFLFLGGITTGILMRYSDELRTTYGIAFVQAISAGHVYVAITFTALLQAMFIPAHVSTIPNYFIFASLIIYCLGISILIPDLPKLEEKSPC